MESGSLSKIPFMILAFGGAIRRWPSAISVGAAAALALAGGPAMAEHVVSSPGVYGRSIFCATREAGNPSSKFAITWHGANGEPEAVGTANSTMLACVTLVMKFQDVAAASATRRPLGPVRARGSGRARPGVNQGRRQPCGQPHFPVASSGRSPDNRIPVRRQMLRPAK
jgi:hypothetical protein